jgi:hypothetical protein
MSSRIPEGTRTPVEYHCSELMLLDLKTIGM